MQKHLLAIVALFVIAAMSVVNGAAISDEPVLMTMQSANGNEINDTQAGQLANKSWNTFVENYDYQSEILNQTLNGNITSNEAMVSITALFVLNSQALDEAKRMNLGEKYATFHNYTINSMTYYNVYLYNMAKLFETKNGKYSRIARDAFNLSKEYYEMGKEEAEFIY